MSTTSKRPTLAELKTVPPNEIATFWPEMTERERSAYIRTGHNCLSVALAELIRQKVPLRAPARRGNAKRWP